MAGPTLIMPTSPELVRREISLEWLRIMKEPSERVVEFVSAVRKLKLPPTYDLTCYAHPDGSIRLHVRGFRYDPRDPEDPTRAKRAYHENVMTTEMIDGVAFTPEEFAREQTRDLWELFHECHLEDWMNQ